MLSILLSIFIIQIVYVSASTLRIILTLKGQKYYASAISTVEIVVYVLGLNLVLQYLDHTLSLVVYAIGYGLGILVGSWIEEKIALGYVTLKVITNNAESALANKLRNNGYGVTSWLGSGRDGDRLVLEVLAKRKNEKKLYNLILSQESTAFIVTLEPKHLHGGFWTKVNRH
jgi:uncharacterized protein YebE (UPF0316 family)